MSDDDNDTKTKTKPRPARGPLGKLVDMIDAAIGGAVGAVVDAFSPPAEPVPVPVRVDRDRRRHR